MNLHGVDLHNCPRVGDHAGMHLLGAPRLNLYLPLRQSEPTNQGQSPKLTASSETSESHQSDAGGADLKSLLSHVSVGGGQLSRRARLGNRSGE